MGPIHSIMTAVSKLLTQYYTLTIKTRFIHSTGEDLL